MRPAGSRLKSFEGASCNDLPGFVVDKYFDCVANRDVFLARTAKAICSRCVALDDCREEALTMANLQPRGIIGGVTASEIRRARAWRSYELGQRPTPPPGERPDWLERSEAAELVEQAAVETDPDELFD